MIQLETCDTWGTSGCVPLFLWKIIRIKISQSKCHHYQGNVFNSVNYLAQFLAKWPTLRKSKNKSRFPKCARILHTCCRDSTPEWWVVGPCLSEQLFLWSALLLLAEDLMWRQSDLRVKTEKRTRRPCDFCTYQSSPVKSSRSWAVASEVTKSAEENEEFKFDKDRVQIDKYVIMFLPV